MKKPLNDERFLNFARSYLREFFPNPERTGCPLDEELQKLAYSPLKADATLTAHLSCCSPCYVRYAALLEEQKLRLRSGMCKSVTAWFALRARPAFAVLGAVILLCLGTVLLMFRHSPEPTRMSVILDLRGASQSRGLDTKPSETEVRVPRCLLNLKIQLPFGAKDGMYSVSLQTGQAVVWSQDATAKVIDHVMTLELVGDFRRLPTGKYQLQVQSGQARFQYSLQIT